jgi:hypothetical protein
MIGRVHFRTGGVDAVATLDDFGIWSVAVDHPDAADVNRALADDLNVRHSIADYSPADGPPGYKLLRDVAKEWGGRVEAPEPPPTIPGLLY